MQISQRRRDFHKGATGTAGGACAEGPVAPYNLARKHSRPAADWTSL
ncbi:MAG: hypothetical protein DMG71_16535 [Acidobacteria bacterium]|nr:MAG: hypothetical protein DMG71_16535 [Acidobacteriota bacterium]